MSEQESNICEICGNHKMIHYEGWKSPLSVEELSQWHKDHPGQRSPLCSCKPEPAQKHDGNLDEDNHMHVQFEFGKYVEVSDTASEYGFKEGDRLLFYAQQFLSLLDWGEQNRAEIERLAKEQGNHE